MVEAVKHMRTMTQEISKAKAAYESGNEGALRAMAREIGCDMRQTAQLGRLPVVNFAAGGIAAPADAALMMPLGCGGVFVGPGSFKSGNAAKRAKAIVGATTHYRDAAALAEVSEGLGEVMVGTNYGSTMVPPHIPLTFESLGFISPLHYSLQ
jgi:pyridoxal 5'-phosphate synthase pdxS subunit